MFATPAQMNFIRTLAAKKGLTANQAALDYGFAPGHALSVSDASSLINDLKGLSIEEAQKADGIYRFRTTGRIGCGVRVSHARFGNGTVEGIIGKEAVVIFDAVPDGPRRRTFEIKSLLPIPMEV